MRGALKIGVAMAVFAGVYTLGSALGDVDRAASVVAKPPWTVSLPWRMGADG